jgi:hypothetical protein
VSHSVQLIRYVSKRPSPDKIKAQIDFIVGRALASNRGRGWEETSRKFEDIIETSKGWRYSCLLVLEKTSGRGRDGEVEFKQWQDIKAMLELTGKSAKFKETPWKVIFKDGDDMGDATVTHSDESDESQPSEEITGVKTVAGSMSEKVLDWSDLKIPDELLESDQALAEHPAFSDLYDLGPQIRTVLSAIKRAIETNGASRNHSVLYGEPGCGKTSTLRAVEKLFGPGSVLHLDATSTTKAGIEKLFFSELKQYPRLVFLEEAEKAPEDGLKIWLGALDDRGELRKVNFRQTQIREIQILFFCTANNKRAFDNMMGTGSGEPGALSSRCVNEIQFPRPAESTLRKILEKEIDQKGGKKDWITPCLELAKELKVSDPRKVKAFLTGGDRLLDGTYQWDQRKIRGPISS